MPDHEYDVEMCRTYYGHATLRVTAPNMKKAKVKALDTPNVEYSGLDGDAPDVVISMRRLPDKPKAKKPPKMVEGSDEWEKAANKVARCGVVLISCRHCGYPVHEGYTCSGCGSSSPR